MAKGGKLTKFMKKLSFGKRSKSNNSSLESNSSFSSSSSSDNAISTTLHPVYVGQSRRQYLLTTDIVSHPLFQQLSAAGGQCDNEEIRVGCEVVMFEHLLWMLENGDHQPLSLDDLVEYYTC